MNDLVFDRVDTPEKFASWREFAASFDHDSATQMTPIVNVSKRDKSGNLVRFGFYSILTHGVLFPSFHPKFTTPRNFVDMVSAFSNAQCLSSISPQYPNGCSFVGLVSNGLPVARNVVTRLGYENLNVELHRRIP